MKSTGSALLLLAAALTAGCSDSHKTSPEARQPSTAGTEPEEGPVAYSALPTELRTLVDRKFTGDLDAIVERRVIRAGVPFNRTFYFIDKGQPRGLTYEYLTLFEEELNKKLSSGNLKVHVVPLATPRDRLLAALNDGKVDLVIAQLTVTPERQKLVDFTKPTRTGVSEVVVTGPSAPPIESLDDLSGKTVFVRRSSSYYESLGKLNAMLRSKGRPPVDVKAAPESLEDDDILEMVDAGLVPATVVDSYMADFWMKIFGRLSVHSNLALRSGGNLAIAIRKNSPKLQSELNGFIDEFGMESVTGQVLNRKYLVSTTYAKDATSKEEREKFLHMVDLFKRYGDQYDFDYLLMAAQGYQESRLDQQARSRVGAVGVMQLMPETGREQNVGDIHQLEPNIHAGVKYMRFMRNRYFEGEPMDDLNKGLFTFAAYNAGPGRIQRLRRETADRGLDPNVWFGNVEQITSEQVGREPVTYVSNIYKYYIAYRLISEQHSRRQKTRSSSKLPG